MGVLLDALVLYPAYAAMKAGFDPKDLGPKSEGFFNHNKVLQSRHVSRVL